MRAALAGLLLFTGACSCEGDQLGDGEALLTAEPRRIDVGRVFVGNSARASFVLSAPGNLSVAYRTELAGDAAGWQVGPAVGRLPPNGTLEMFAIFRPASDGPATARAILFGTGSKNATVAVELVGIGVVPPDCEDGNGCTADSFDLEAGRCRHELQRLPCNDFNGCTTADTCVEGICLGESFSCDDDNVCTDDLCDPRTGCTHVPARVCADDNPCTFDRCDPRRGCTHEVLADGTPCDDLEQCTIADICLAGECRGVVVPEGAECNDGDPCTHEDQCVEGVCKDPTYVQPGLGGVKFATDLGALAPGAGEDPILDRDSTAFVAVEGGVAAVDRCGELLWLNTELGTPQGRATVSLPGLLSLAVGGSLIDVDSSTGQPLRRLDLGDLFPPVQTASTATSTVLLVDLALRASGALVASVVRETRQGASLRREGLLAEIDRTHTSASPFRALGARHAARVAVDADEAVLAVLREGPVDKGLGDELLVRYGLDGQPASSWSTSPITARRTELALGPGGEVYWTRGLAKIQRSGAQESWAPAPLAPELADHGSPVLSGQLLYLAHVAEDHGPLSLGPAFLLEAFDLADGVRAWSAALPADPRGHSPCVDGLGNVFLATGGGLVSGYTATGQPMFHTQLPIGAASVHGTALTLTAEGVLLVLADGRLIGLQTIGPLAASPWPRHRRDNLASGHR